MASVAEGPLKLAPVLLALLAGNACIEKAGATSPLELVATIALPGVKGRIDHFSADLAGHRLFVAALGNGSVEVLNTAANRHEKSLPGFGEPQGVLYLASSRRLFVANGSADRVDVLDGGSFARLARVGDLPDADNLRYDAASHRAIVGYGSGALRLMDEANPASAAEIRLPGHPESFQLEAQGTRIFVNVPDAKQVAVADRASGKLLATWEVPGASANFPMALDEAGKRLFVAARRPAVLLVYDTDSGKVVATLPLGGDSDDLFFDPAKKRLYAVCGEGRVDVFSQETGGKYMKETSITTAPRARTGLFVPEEGKLYVAAPADGGVSARVLVYRIR